MTGLFLVTMVTSKGLAADQDWRQKDLEARRIYLRQLWIQVINIPDFVVQVRKSLNLVSAKLSKVCRDRNLDCTGPTPGQLFVSQSPYPEVDWQKPGLAYRVPVADIHDPVFVDRAVIDLLTLYAFHNDDVLEKDSSSSLQPNRMIRARNWARHQLGWDFTIEAQPRAPDMGREIPVLELLGAGSFIPEKLNLDTTFDFRVIDDSFARVKMVVPCGPRNLFILFSRDLPPCQRIRIASLLSEDTHGNIEDRLATLGKIQRWSTAGGLATDFIVFWRLAKNLSWFSGPAKLVVAAADLFVAHLAGQVVIKLGVDRPAERTAELSEFLEILDQQKNDVANDRADVESLRLALYAYLMDKPEILDDKSLKNIR